MSLIWDAMSCGRTKGEDESPPERRRTNGDIKSLLRPGTRATGVLCTTAPSLQLSLPSRPRVRDFWIHFVPRTTTMLSREILTLLRKFHRFFFLFFLSLSFFFSTASFVPRMRVTTHQKGFQNISRIQRIEKSKWKIFAEREGMILIF